MRKHRALWLTGLLLAGTGPAWSDASPATSIDAASATTPGSWFETRTAILDLADARDFVGAVALSDTFLSQIAESFGAASDETAQAHLLVAPLYFQSGDFDDGELHFLRAIEIYQDVDGNDTPKIIAPLLALGDNYGAIHKYDLAMASFDEARAISRRNFGLLNQDQLAILDKMSDTALATRDYDKAKNYQLDAMTIVERRFGETSPEFLDANFRYASWLTKNARFGDADRYYFTMHRMIGNDFGDEPLQKVRLLQAQATNYLSAGGRVVAQHGSKPDELDEALKIAEKLDEPDPLLQATILRDLGDWYVSFQRPEAEESYIAAWDMLGKVENGDALREQWFSRLKRIRSGVFRSYALTDDPAAPWGHIELTFTVATNGRPTDIDVRAADPAGVLDEAAIAQLAGSRFRPYIKDGELVPSNGLVAWDYQYSTRYAERQAREASEARDE